MSDIPPYLTENEKLHLTKLEVSGPAVLQNIAFFRSLLGPKTAVMLVVKAQAYGHGAIELAKMVEKQKIVDYFAVAVLDEGITLRKAGIHLPILVLNPNPWAFKSLIEFQLEPEIHNLDLFKKFVSYLQKAPLTQKKYPIHLKFNTGMNRFGIDQVELPQLIRHLDNSHEVEIKSLMTHLSSSGDSKDDHFSLKQLEVFQQIIKALQNRLSQNCFYHALNSNGIFRFPNHHFQMVRLGIGAYGASTHKNLKNHLIPACRFITHISQIRTVKKGETIGYGRLGKAKENSNIATLAVGYADGLNRNLSNGNWEVEINQKCYPTIGVISMDSCMIDLGEDWHEIGTEVIIFGGKKSIQDYALAQKTIPYEALTNISARVKRVLLN